MTVSGSPAGAVRQSTSQSRSSATIVTSPSTAAVQSAGSDERLLSSASPHAAANSRNGTARSTAGARMTRWSSPDPPRFQPGVGPMGDVLASFAVVFLAELGDKTQLVALTLAGRYSALKVLAVLGAALLLLQTLSVTAGALISEVVPDRAIAVGAGVLFLGFAVWTWSTRDEDEDDDGGAGRAGLLRDRKSVGSGKSVLVRVDRGGSR